MPSPELQRAAERLPCRPLECSIPMRMGKSASASTWPVPKRTAVHGPELPAVNSRPSLRSAMIQDRDDGSGPAGSPSGYFGQVGSLAR